jgi:hypothetical protein
MRQLTKAKPVIPAEVEEICCFLRQHPVKTPFWLPNIEPGWLAKLLLLPPEPIPEYDEIKPRPVQVVLTLWIVTKPLFFAKAWNKETVLSRTLYDIYCGGRYSFRAGVDSAELQQEPMLRRLLEIAHQHNLVKLVDGDFSFCYCECKETFASDALSTSVANALAAWESTIRRAQKRHEKRRQEIQAEESAYEKRLWS